jgi:hypothetical protein
VINIKSNNISGPLPESFTRLQNLRFFNADNNKLDPAKPGICDVLEHIECFSMCAHTDSSDDEDDLGLESRYRPANFDSIERRAGSPCPESPGRGGRDSPLPIVQE